MISSIFSAAPRVLGAAALLGAMTIGASATAAPDLAPDTLEAVCAADAGVTVVVDFTDLGGDVEVGCAEGAPASGRAALEDAGFAPEDSMPGMICAIDSHPDPCPEEFDGSFWSYWTATDAHEWETYMVGADEATPAPGAIEGWRYFDGSEGPQVAPLLLAQTSADAGEDEAEDEDLVEEGPPTEETSADATDTDESSSSSRPWIIVAGVAVLAAIVSVIANRRRNTTP